MPFKNRSSKKKVIGKKIYKARKTNELKAEDTLEDEIFDSYVSLGRS